MFQQRPWDKADDTISWNFQGEMHCRGIAFSGVDRVEGLTEGVEALSRASDIWDLSPLLKECTEHYLFTHLSRADVTQRVSKVAK